MEDSSTKRKTPAAIECPACGAVSEDREWCDHCGANLASIVAMPRREWLDNGAMLDFALKGPRRAKPAATNGSAAPAALAPKPASDDAAFELIGAPPAVATPEVDDAESRAGKDAQPTQDVPAEPDAGAGEGEPDDDGHTEATATLADVGVGDDDAEDDAEPRRDPGSTQPIAADAAAASARDAAQSLQVQVVNIRESYAQRRLWDAHDVEDGTRYVLEERRLLTGEDPEAAARFEPVDAFSDRFIYNPVSRQLHEGRLMTLYEAPVGESLESWRRRLGREGATASAILEVLRPIIRAVDEIHRGGRVHLHLNPRTIWSDPDGTVGFTGVDALENVPVSRTRFRATVGFSAPELFGRSAQDIGSAADIYSLGAVTYYLIAGVIPPVAPETAFAPALAPRDFRPAFPIGWAEIVLRATDPVPSRRFATANEYLEALERGFRHMVARSTHSSPVLLFAATERHIGFAKQQRCPVNQDHVFMGHDPERGRMLLAVADGVSTASFGSGDLASGFLAARAEEVWDGLRSGELDLAPEEIVQRIMIAANRDIVDYVNERHGPLDAAPSEVMGSTALVAVVLDGTMTLGSLGDSRVYVIRKDLMECVTRDHNLFTLSLIEGLGIEEVLMMPHGDALARCLGTFDVDRDGYLLTVDPPIDMYRFKLLPGDNILMCTDGLFDYAGSTYEESEANIRRRVLADSHPGLACLELILLANRGGGGDNIGCALLEVLSEDGTIVE